MGGCRCTYRNCMVKTDGKTHMFHYPVFDKVRCHQWLINAHRLEFLNLKVSQLKNRVVCQHHFKDEYFMNFKKEKLTFEAIPTEDGPYCDPSKWIDNSQEFSNLYPIVLEDIENEYFSTNDKKANFSLKYLDFLTNSESMENSYLKNEMNTLPTTQSNNLAELNFVLDNNTDDKINIINNNINETDLLNHKLIEIKNKINKFQVQPMLIVPPFSEKNNKGETIKGNECLKFNLCPVQNDKSQTRPTSQNTKPKVRIISEKKITNPVPLTGNFEPISPSVLLNVAHLKSNNFKTKDIMLENMPPEEHINITKQEVESIMLPKQEIASPQNAKNGNIQNIKALNQKLNTPKDSNGMTKVSILKSKIPPERIAAIKEKRKFNMKLKDVIESHVIKLEAPSQNDDKNIEQLNEPYKEKVQSKSETRVLQNSDAYISSLEARMTRMENLLLNKIDQNSQRIIDLKKSLETTSQKKKTASTQTTRNEEAYKKFLYSEISKYLSSESNSTIYQELFIDKFAQNTSHKRRKYR